MALSIQIFLGILVLASFVIAFFSARTWHWGYVLVVLGIFLSTLLYLVLASETLRIYAVLGREINRLERDLATVQAQNDALRRGTEDANIIAQLQSAEPAVLMLKGEESLLSLAELDHRLLLATRRRGPVWWNVMPASAINPQTGEFSIAVEQPVPAGFPLDTVVYVFEQGPAQLPTTDGRPQGAQYLGEFRITKAAGQQATLVPVQPMDNFERQRLAASRGPWTVYQTMPADRHEIFAGMNEQELRQKIPSQSVDEYLRHGQEATPTDPEERQVGFDADGNRLPPEQLASAVKRVYQRRLRDYTTELDELSRRRVAMEVDIEALKKDIERLTAALASAKKLQSFREDQIKKLQTDLSGVAKERQAIEAHLAQVNQQLERVRELLADALKRNRELVDRLAQSPLKSSGAGSPSSAVPLALGAAN